jgi:hypothetical protein
MSIVDMIDSNRGKSLVTNRSFEKAWPLMRILAILCGKRPQESFGEI